VEFPDKAPYYFSGHLHPGIRIRGMGKQSLQFPCFYFGTEYAVLPAFGKFTGTVSIDPLPESNVFAILPRSTPVSSAAPAAFQAADRRRPMARPSWTSGPKGPGTILQIQ
jgi:metallophosphoesterase superfamily enzyme